VLVIICVAVTTLMSVTENVMKSSAAAGVWLMRAAII